MVRLDIQHILSRLTHDLDSVLDHVTHHGYNNLQPIQVYTIADNLLSLFFFCPLIVLFSQSTDAILELLISNNLPTLGPWIVLTLGITLELLCSFYQTIFRDDIVSPGADCSAVKQQPSEHAGAHRENGLTRNYQQTAHAQANELRSAASVHSSMVNTAKETELLQVLATRSFNYILAFAGVCHYRGVYDIYVSTEGAGVVSGVAAGLTAIVGLWGLKAGRNILGSPLCVTTDDVPVERFFKVDTLLNYKTDCSLESFLDHVTTIVVMQSLVHLHWTGVWLVLDALTLSTYIPFVSCMMCLLIGYLFVIVFMCIQYHAQYVSARLQDDGKHTLKLVFENLFLLIANVGSILVWKGLWGGFEVYEEYFPVFYWGFDITLWVGHVCSYLLLCLAQVTNSLPAKCCERDGEYNNGIGVRFPTGYFTQLIGDVDSLWPASPPTPATGSDSDTPNGDVTNTEGERVARDEEDDDDDDEHIKYLLTVKSQAEHARARRRKKQPPTNTGTGEEEEEGSKSLDHEMRGSSNRMNRTDESWRDRSSSVHESHVTDCAGM